MAPFYVYIMASRSRTLYTGVTGDLERRVAQHRSMVPGSFTARYRVVHLVHYEVTNDVRAAIAREKQIKGWNRGKRVALVEEHNAGWGDLLPAGHPPDVAR
jgi:putative endonuclease